MEEVLLVLGQGIRSGRFFMIAVLYVKGVSRVSEFYWLPSSYASVSDIAIVFFFFFIVAEFSLFQFLFDVGNLGKVVS